MKRPDDFPAKIAIKVSERAGYLCSNPICNRFTCGPCASDPAKSAKAGVAAHICAASPGGPRYDQFQTPRERKSIGNAIWLCATCALLIDKNNGVDYPAPQLRKWKEDHECQMKILVESGFNPLARFPQMSHVTQEAQTAVRLVRTLEDKGMLYVAFQQEDPTFVALSIDDLRRQLRAIREGVVPDSSIDHRLKAMVDACRHYMNTTPSSASPKVMQEALAGLRKTFGLHLKQMKSQYGLQFDNNLETLLPED